MHACVCNCRHHTHEISHSLLFVYTNENAQERSEKRRSFFVRNFVASAPKQRLSLWVHWIENLHSQQQAHKPDIPNIKVIMHKEGKRKSHLSKRYKRFGWAKIQAVDKVYWIGSLQLVVQRWQLANINTEGRGYNSGGFYRLNGAKKVCIAWSKDVPLNKWERMRPCANKSCKFVRIKLERSADFSLFWK